MRAVLSTAARRLVPRTLPAARSVLRRRRWWACACGPWAAPPRTRAPSSRARARRPHVSAARGAAAGLGTGPLPPPRAALPQPDPEGRARTREGFQACRVPGLSPRCGCASPRMGARRRAAVVLRGGRRSPPPRCRPAASRARSPVALASGPPARTPHPVPAAGSCVLALGEEAGGVSGRSGRALKGARSNREGAAHGRKGGSFNKYSLKCSLLLAGFLQ